MLDPSFGEIKVKTSTWGYDDDDEYIYEEKYLDLHLCTKQELGLEGESSIFMPIKESSAEELELMAGKMLCLAEEDAYVYGNFNSDNARMLYIEIVKCVGLDYCANDDEIKDHLRGKYLNLMNNRRRFDSRYFLEDSLLVESLLTWVPIQTQIQ